MIEVLARRNSIGEALDFIDGEQPKHAERIEYRCLLQFVEIYKTVD